MKNKTIVFVGGSAYSGSTILDMMIASGGKGISIGEAHALFYPFRKKHLTPICGCGSDECNIWYEIKEKKPSQLYTELFKRFPESEFIVDSSKDPLWIKEQSDIAISKGMDVKNVLIWKEPQGFALSQIKRGNRKRWERPWINYYRLYYSIIDNIISVNYEKLVENPKSVLKAICDQLDIEYFEGKEFYWNFKHHTLYGNNSAKVHLYNEKSDGFNRVADELNELNPSYLTNKHKKIYYDSNRKKTLPASIHNQIKSDRNIVLIERLLNKSDQKSLHGIGNVNDIDGLRDKIQFSPFSVILRKCIRKSKQIKNHYMIERLGAH